MNPNIYQEKVGIWFSLLWSFIITGTIVFVNGNLYSGFNAAYPGVYHKKFWFLSIPIFVCLLLSFNIIKLNRRKAVENLERRQADLSEDLSTIQSKKNATLEKLRRLK